MQKITIISSIRCTFPVRIRIRRRTQIGYIQLNRNNEKPMQKTNELTVGLFVKTNQRTLVVIPLSRSLLLSSTDKNFVFKKLVFSIGKMGFRLI